MIRQELLGDQIACILNVCMPVWQRDRKAWNFYTKPGPGLGIWGSEDGGDNWKLLTE